MSTGLISPQYHVVFDDSFTTTLCLNSNTLPSNWPVLLESSQAKFVDDNFSLDPFIDPSCFIDNPSLTMDHYPPTQTSSFQREPSTDVLSSSSSSQREHITTLPLSLTSNNQDPSLIPTSSLNESTIVPTLQSSTTPKQSSSFWLEFLSSL
jgi:hypothetical protein